MPLSRLIIVAVFSTFIVGCTATKMPLQAENPKFDMPVNKSILVARIKIRNENHKSYQPDLSMVRVTAEHNNKKEGIVFNLPTLITQNGEEGKDYFMSMLVPAGKVIVNFVSFASGYGQAEAFFNSEINVEESKIIYIGNITAVIVHRDDDSQPRAGGLFPLLDQYVPGFSNGTFKLAVADQYDADTKELLEEYPYLVGKKIEKNIMPLASTTPMANN